MTTPNRCKCGKFATVSACPDCRKRREQEDKTVKFLIGEIVRPVKEPVVKPKEAVICYAGE